MTKPISPAMINLILTQRRFNIAELYTIELKDGSLDYFTNLDMTLIIAGITYKANALRFEGLKFKLGVGWQVDEQDLKISAYPGETLGGADFFGAVESGLLDGAYITRVRAFWLMDETIAYQVYRKPPLQLVTLFTGRVSTVGKIGRTHVEMKLKSPMVLLDIDMPRNTYQPGCQWVLYSSGCTVARAGFTSSYTVDTANTTSIKPTSAPSPATGADGLPNFAQGRLLFTSGVNNNLEVSLANNDGTYFYPRFPLIEAPAPGDTFTASAGCSKLSTTCDTKFSNLVNFRGYPRVPPIVVSV